MTITYDETILELDPKFVHANPDNPRTSGPGDVTELANSIREQGVLEPCLARPAEDRFGPGHVILDAGERRLTACRFLKIPVPCRIGVLASDANPIEHTLITGLTENGSRNGLSAIERAKAYSRLIREFKLTQAALAQRLGINSGSVSRTLALLELSPRTQQAVIEKKLTVVDAQKLITQHRQTQRKKAGRKSQPLDYQPATFTSGHFLASKAKRLCNESDHDGRIPVRVGDIACDMHWERAIRLDEAKVQQLAARESGFDIPFMSPEMAAAGSKIGRNGAYCGTA